MKILMILSSATESSELNSQGPVPLDELAAPYYIFKDAGAEITLASRSGDRPTVGLESEGERSGSESGRRFQADSLAQDVLGSVRKVSDAKANDFDAVFYVSGHGEMRDLSEDADSIALIESAFAAGKPVGAVCHAPNVLRHVKNEDGSPLLQGKNVTGISNSEEAVDGSGGNAPFRLEDVLKNSGGNYSKGDDGEACVVTDRLLVTGQNAASSGLAAKAILERLRIIRGR